MDRPSDVAQDPQPPLGGGVEGVVVGAGMGEVVAEGAGAAVFDGVGAVLAPCWPSPIDAARPMESPFVVSVAPVGSPSTKVDSGVLPRGAKAVFCAAEGLGLPPPPGGPPQIPRRGLGQFTAPVQG